MTRNASLISEAKRTFGTYFSFLLLLIGAVSFILQIGWTVHQKRLSEGQTRKAIAQVLEKPIRDRDIALIKQILLGFSISNPNMEICLEIGNQMVSGSDDCQYVNLEKYKTQYTNESFLVGVQIRSFDFMVRWGIFMLFIAIGALALLNRRVKWFTKRMVADLQSLLNDPSASLSFFEFSEIQTYMKRNVELERENGQMRSKIALGELAAQVAHDVRSPLAALEMITTDLDGVPEEKRIILRSAIRRIKDIANGLLVKNQVSSPGGHLMELENSCNVTSSTLLLPALIEDLITEKRTQYRSKIGVEIDLEFGAGAYGLFVNVQPVELKRVLSNLINNSVEALGSVGTVRIMLDCNRTEATIVVKDNGKGIPGDVLPKLMRRGATYGKAGGSGLGLFHARENVNRWGGSLSLWSKVGEGTEVSFSLPCMPAPDWFVPELSVAPKSIIVVLDDDTSIHQIWRERFGKAKLYEHGVETLHFSTPKEVREWFYGNFSVPLYASYLVDFELIGEREDGLSLIEELKINKDSILVTSRYEEHAIRRHCARLGVRLIPKGMVGFVPIKSIREEDQTSSDIHSDLSKSEPDAILIDDDELVHMNWRLAAKQTGRSFAGFKSVNDFLSKRSEFDVSVPIYIDSILGEDQMGNKIRGELLARRIREFGFKTIYLATGLNPDDLDVMPWLSGVRGKEPPFLEM